MTAKPSRSHRVAEAYQEQILPGVSRTFALTIPQLPAALRGVVTNAYLLCRIADTIEDEPELTASQKAAFHEQFLAALNGEEPPQRFAGRVAPLLSAATLTQERDLMSRADLVIRYTHGLETSQRAVLVKCVKIMCRGMGHYQNGASLAGLANLDELDRYCYHVAGVVGEMLTELFCHYSPEVQRRRVEMLALAPSFGEGLQLTNILKDLWEDRAHGVCWFPRKELAEHGVDLAQLTPGRQDAAFAEAIRYLVGVAHAHLRQAFHYTLMVPPHEAGIRRFCLWAIGLAVLTLWRIHRHPSYTCGQDVKVSRRIVKATILGTQLTGQHDRLLRLLFATVTTGLPLEPLPTWDPQSSPWRLESTQGNPGVVGRHFLGGTDNE